MKHTACAFICAISAHAILTGFGNAEATLESYRLAHGIPEI